MIDEANAMKLRRKAGETIKAWREAAGLTQLDVAKRVGFDYYNFVSAVELGRNKVPLEKYDIWADALGCDRREFSLTMIKFYYPNLAKCLLGS